MKVSSYPTLDCLVDEKVWPPGFRFYPSDEELVLYYLKRKICRRRLKPDIIAEIDVYKSDPEDLPGQSILKTQDRQWFFFSPKDRSYSHRGRSNRATENGFWKVTGRDRAVTCNSRTVGTKKTLVFYRGRAPKGERTNWVMHEYVVHENEFKQCSTEQDYYVLYKVFKKSGCGPRNGEQYGAPFQEEDWADDECSDVNTVKPNDISSTDNFSKECQLPSTLNDDEDSASRNVHLHAFDELYFDAHAHAPQDVGDVVSQSTARFDQSETESAIGLNSAPNTSQLNSNEDFLEIGDLIGLVPSFSNDEKFPIEELDGLSGFDLFHDAEMFVRDINPVEWNAVSNPCINNFENETINQFDYPLHYTYNAEQNSELWMNDQDDHLVFTSAETSHGAVCPPVVGAACEDDPASCISTRGSQAQADNDNGGEDQLLSAAIWAFVGSIPAAPASASEHPLVNRALERISSFSRVRIGARNEAASAAKDSQSVVKWKKGSSVKGFFFFSLVGAACAILWVLMKGTVMSVQGRQ